MYTPKTCTVLFIATLFTKPQNLKKSKCLPTEGIYSGIFIGCNNTQELKGTKTKQKWCLEHWWISSILGAKETKYKISYWDHILYEWFYTSKDEEQAKLVFDDRNKNSGYRLRRDMRRPYSIWKCILIWMVIRLFKSIRL